MGLGLAVSRAIAEAHGGSLEARGGGEFHLILPCQPR
jgi:signal transduction histidine kinase